MSEAQGGAAVEARDIPYLADMPDPLIRQIARTLLDELTAPSAAGRVLVETLALALTARLAQTCAPKSPHQAEALGVGHGLDDARFQRVLAFIEEHIEDDVGVDDLARAACLSPFHFVRMFSRRAGMPPSRYLGRRRLKRAEALLAAGEMTVAEIALACCFSSQSNFTRAFRRSTGTTPAAFRRDRR